MKQCYYSLLMIGFLFLSSLITSCKDQSAEILKEKLRVEYQQPKKTTLLSSGSKAQYLQMENTINREYVAKIDSLVNSGFSIQLERFEREELGVWSSYTNMFFGLFSSKQSWDDAMIVMSNKYFNPLDLSQAQHALYLDYTQSIKTIRQQFLSSNGLPSYTQISLPEEAIALTTFSEHSKNNLIIEFGVELFQWLLGFLITQLIVFCLDKIIGPWGCLVDIVVFIIIITISIFLSSSNDTRLMESLQNQHKQTTVYNYNSLLETLDDNSKKFYEDL